MSSNRLLEVEALKNLRSSPPYPITNRDTARWITDEECLVLYQVLQIYRINYVIECGTANGYSTCWIVQSMLDNYMKKIKVTTWDIEDRPKLWDTNTLSNLKLYINFNHSSFAKTFSIDRTPQDRVAFFIDGDHSREAFKEDWKTIVNFVQNNDIVILHDTLNYRWITRHVMNLLADSCWDGGFIRTQRGMAVLWPT